jgi:hypothetical protein
MVNVEHFFCWNNWSWWNWFSSLKRRPTIEQLRCKLVIPNKGFVAFHACRPTDVNAYYSEGLKPANFSSLASEARNLFRSGDFPVISEADFEMAVKAIPEIGKGKLYLSLDDRLPKENGAYSHYLLYGSEHVLGVAVQFMELKKSTNGTDYRQILKRRGIPTIFRVALPFEMVPHSDIDQFLPRQQNLWVNFGSGSRPSV